jgi:hypothetical protein
MITRSEDLGGLLQTMKPHLPINGFNPFLWLLNDKNICLTDGDGNFTLFEYVRDGVYNGHIFFVARGKEAIRISKEMLEYVFTEYPVKTLVGYTPLCKKGALWLMQHLGFKKYGTIFINEGEENQVWGMTQEMFNGK